MKHSKFTQHLAAAAAHIATATSKAAHMIEIDGDNEFKIKVVTNIANEIREQLLWMEREAFKATNGADNEND